MQILGYFWNLISSDREVVSVKVEELANMSELENFSYQDLKWLRAVCIQITQKRKRD